MSSKRLGKISYGGNFQTVRHVFWLELLKLSGSHADVTEISNIGGDIR